MEEQGGKTVLIKLILIRIGIFSIIFQYISWLGYRRYNKALFHEIAFSSIRYSKYNSDFLMNCMIGVMKKLKITKKYKDGMTVMKLLVL